jgi:hypothetical protein
MAHTYNPSYSGGTDQEEGSLKPAQAKSKTLTQKYPTQKKTSGVAHGVELLSSNFEALSSNPSTARKKEKYELTADL